MKKYGFEFCDVSYKSRDIYTRGYLELQEHTINVIVGDNGTGKTTLINNLFYNYRNISTKVSQNNSLMLEDLSVIENVCLSNYSKQDEAIKLFDELNFSYLINRKVKHLSGGERRICLLIRALISDRELIFIDEPTNNIDNKRVDIIRELLLRLSKEKTLLVVTHDSRIEELASNIFTIRDKKVVCLKESHCNDFSATTQDLEVSKMKIKYEKIFRKSYFPTICLGLFFLVFILMNVVLQTGKNELATLPEHQVDVASSTSRDSKLLFRDGFLPLYVIQNYKNMSKIELIEETLSYINSKEVNQSTAMIPEVLIEEFDPLVNEYFEVVYDSKINIVNLYWNEKYQDSGEYPNIDNAISHPQYLINPMKRGPVPTEFDKELFVEIAKRVKASYRSGDLYVINASIIGKDDSFKRLLLIYQNNENVSPYILIRSNETIEIVGDTFFLISNVNVIKYLLFSGLLFVVFLFLFYNQDFKLQKWRIISVRDLGVESNDLRTHFLRNRVNKKLLITTVALAITINLATLYIVGRLDNIFAYISVLFSIIVIASFGIYSKFIVRRIEKIFDFGGVYSESKD